MGKKFKVIFIVLFFAVSLAPLVLMPRFGNQEAEGSDADVSMAPLFIGGKLNTGFFEGAGNYFSKKFALRREMVTLGDIIKAKVFGVSGQDGVVLGRKGYLFYKDSFNDYLGRDSLSDYQIASMAYNIDLMKSELEEQGIDFLFTVAPNKNSLYPELMPKKYKPEEEKRNMRRLRPLLRESGVRYLNLYKLFNDLGEVMYLKGDSHWNNAGAGLVTGEIMTALQHKRTSYDDGRSETRKDFKGDLYNMLYPSGNITDEQVYYDRMDPSVYNERVEVRTIDDMTGEMKGVDPADDPDWPKSSEIETLSFGDAEGSLLMIRDSFGNSLTPFMAEEFSRALFLNGTPYEIGRAVDEGYDTVVFETVERNLDRLINDAPVISTTDAGISEETKDMLSGLLSGENEYEGSLKAELSDSEFDYTYITGTLDPEKTEEKTKIYAVLRSREDGSAAYHALFRTESYKCAAYIKTEEIPEGEYDLHLAYENSDGWHVSRKLGTYKAEEE